MLGVVGSRYRVVQNADAFAFTDDLIGGEVRYETAGSLNDGRQWVSTSRNVVYTPGATYRVEFDVKIEGEGTATEGQTLDPDEKLHVNCDFQYADGDVVDHNAFGALLSMNDGWVHVTGTHTVSADSTDRSHDGFGFFSHPPRDYGVNYRVDNIVVTRVA